MNRQAILVTGAAGFIGDHCSTDSTVDVVQKYHDDRIRLLSNDQNSGVSFSRKRGMEAAEGEWIAVLDSDDAWTPDKLEKQMRLQAEKEAELVFPGSAFMAADGRPIEWILHVLSEIRYRQLLKQNLVSNSSVLVRKNLYAASFTIGDQMHEDFAIWLKLLKWKDGIWH